LGEVMPWRVDLHHYDLEADARKGGKGRELSERAFWSYKQVFDQHI